VDNWYRAIFSGGTEVCQNLICLSPTAHAYWGKGYFALKPISLTVDNKRLNLQIYWLSRNVYVPRVGLQNPPSLPAHLDHGPNLSKLWDHETEMKIHSGHEICLTTDDPELRPLPDCRLLEMQWILHRITAMSGAAEAPDDSDNHGDGDGGGGDWGYERREDDLDWESDETGSGPF
jgi:hypothetical protein